MKSSWVPEQSTSHTRLLDSARRSVGHTRFDAILVPTNRPVEFLSECIGLAQQATTRLIIVCSKRVNKSQVIEIARRENIEVFSVDLPPCSDNSLEGIAFGTSMDGELLAASSGKTRDLSTKRNLGLVIAKMLGWQRLMFLDDDIYGVSMDDVQALAAALYDHNVSVLIPEDYPDNSVACGCGSNAGGRSGRIGDELGITGVS